MSQAGAERRLRLEPWHVGGVVADIRQAIAEHRMLGAVGVSDVATLDFDTYDGVAGTFVRETLDVAYVELAAGRGALELISPRERYPVGPQARLLRERPGLSHTAYWCDDLIEAATWLLGQGAELILAPLIGLSGSHAGLEWGSVEELLTVSQTCYLRLRGGGIIELNPVASRLDMPQIWGGDMLSLLPVPQAWPA